MIFLSLLKSKFVFKYKKEYTFSNNIIGFYIIQIHKEKAAPIGTAFSFYITESLERSC